MEETLLLHEEKSQTFSGDENKDSNNNNNNNPAISSSLVPLSPPLLLDSHHFMAPPPVLEHFSDTVASLWMSSIPRLSHPPTALDFLRDHVAPSRPCIIQNAIRCQAGDNNSNNNNNNSSSNNNNQGRRPLLLTVDDIVQRLQQPDATRPEQSIQITVDVTPDGHGDCLRWVEGTRALKPPLQSPKQENDPIVTHPEPVVPETNHRQQVFVQPEERIMSLVEFRDQLRQGCPENAIGGARDKRDTWSSRSKRGAVEDRVFRQSVKNQPLEHLQSNCGGDDADDGNGNNPNNRPGVPYYSRQNDCLRTEFAKLWQQNLFPSGFDWAEEAFQQSQPDAVNLWMGNQCAVSSMHKDHYENLFYVLSGEKIFTLCPPADAPFLYERAVPSGRFRYQQTENHQGEWTVDLEYEESEEDHLCQHENLDDSDCSKKLSFVRWVHADVTKLGEKDGIQSSHQHEFPLLRYTHPIQVHVRPGEMLYVPALWYHRVTQTCETVAVNYWYDMRFDSPGWCYFDLLQQLQMVVANNENQQPEKESRQPVSTHLV